MKNMLFGLIILAIAAPVFATENTTSFTAKKLISSGYILMTGAVIRKELIGRTVTIVDLLAGSEYEAKFLADGKSELKKTKDNKPGTLTDADYQERAPLLTGFNTFTIKGDTVMTTDGVRSYTSKLYKKGNVILGVRNVDNGKVYFQINK